MKQRKSILISLLVVFSLLLGTVFYLIAIKENDVTEKITQAQSSSQISESTISYSESQVAESLPAEPDIEELNVALRAAISENNKTKIEEMLSKGAFVDTVNAKKESGLLLATHHDDHELAQLFLNYGANVNLQDAIQDSPFLYAGAEGRTEILRMMLPHHPDTKITNRFGGNALIPAAEKGHLANVQLLLEQTDVDVNHINTPGWTALLEAIVYTNGDENQQKIIRVLLDYGADPNLADSQGITPIQHAKSRGFEEIVAILRAAGAKE